MTDSDHLIIVEDEPITRSQLRAHFEAAGFVVEEREDGVGLLERVLESGSSIVLLDIRLPGKDGLTLAREIRAASDVGIILVTSQRDQIDKLIGLESGADDYVTKPFVPDELRARVRAALRRHSLFMPDQPLVRAGPYSLDSLSLTLSRDGSDLRVRFTETQARILRLLMQHHGQALSRDSLVSRRVNGTEDRSVDVHVANIRRRLRNAGVDELIIGPVRGLGYRLGLTCA